ncbi:acyltransferase [Serratia proteamaculans]|uniref:acyltransferase family protein n=1 Tax=Serratia proteamaculans TaxID=28151 RepID=UPI0015763420|nr:acyltransferase [Serratia proteamaculans]NTX81023.1 acyltransferase [Serratia proteamaculans]NTZ30225.1 acyltransferase [Serratia proteamaculans]
MMSNNMINAQRPKNLTSLTGMRIFAALLVFLFHASLGKMLNPFEDLQVANTYALVFKNAGWLGVSFFFILSGFVLTWSANPQQSNRRFWLKRLGKIFPNHLVTWALMLVFFRSYVSDSHAWLPNLFLLSSWSNNIDIFVSVNQPSWTLCSELLFYLLFPAIFLIVRKLPPHWLLHALVALFLMLALTQFAIAQWVEGTPQLKEWPLSENQWWLAYNFPPFRLYEFAAGMIMARLLQAGRHIPLPLSGAVLLVLAAYVATYFVPFQYSLNLLTFIPLCLLITVAAQSDLAGTPTLINARLTVWLGEISFGMYMVHYLVLITAKQMMSGQLYGLTSSLLIILTCLLASLAGGYLLYRYIELPVMHQLAKTEKKPVVIATQSITER